jgi:hypothetical protein
MKGSKVTSGPLDKIPASQPTTSPLLAGAPTPESPPTSNGGGALRVPPTAPNLPAVAPCGAQETLTTPSQETHDALDRLTTFNVLVTGRDEIAGYLTHHSDLEMLLEGICSKVREVFGPDAELALELYKDPEIDDRYLTLYVRQEKYQPGIIDRIEAVASQFMTQLETASGYLLITTDFRRPRGSDAI